MQVGKSLERAITEEQMKKRGWKKIKGVWKPRLKIEITHEKPKRHL